MKLKFRVLPFSWMIGAGWPMGGRGMGQYGNLFVVAFGPLRWSFSTRVQDAGDL